MATENGQQAQDNATAQPASAPKNRSDSFASDDSQTAAEFIRSQELLEADAREALPYSIDNCTRILGPLRQSVFACLTCNPAPATPTDSWTPAGVCYSCSIQCHGEHTLVEIFQKRNFTCDCGTTRLPSTSPCTLQTNDETNTKGGVHSQEPDVNNRYNQNFRNRFCGCECDYDPFEQKGTMFQCLGLGSAESGGCGEDWYHPGCLVGMGPKWYDKMESKKAAASTNGPAEGNGLPVISENDEDAKPNGDKESENKADADDATEDDEPPMPPGFPEEDAFEGFLCYKCIESNPWFKRYAGASGFLPPVFLEPKTGTTPATAADGPTDTEATSKKRKAEDDAEEQGDMKRTKSEPTTEPSAPTEAASAVVKEEPSSAAVATEPTGCKLPNLPAAPEGRFSIFFKEDFRDKLCRCSDCYSKLNAHPQLLEEEEVYEPPMSEDGASEHGGSTHGSGSLLERGESALRNVDRVRAIEGVMAYNHLKDKLKPFFQQFADSGQAISADDIKGYFAKLRGDEEGMKEAKETAASSGADGDDKDMRREQGGY